MNIFLLQNLKLQAEFFRHLLINALPSQLKMEIKQHKSVRHRTINKTAWILTFLGINIYLL